MENAVRPVWSAGRTAFVVVAAVAIASGTAVGVSFADTGSSSTPTRGQFGGGAGRPGGQFGGGQFGGGQNGVGQNGVGQNGAVPGGAAAVPGVGAP